MRTFVNMLVRLAFLCLAMELIAQVCGDSSGGSSGTCPLCDVSTCDNETVLQESCPGVQLVNDPCGCCKQCGRVFNESCGGAYGYLGKCVSKLKCTVDPSVYLSGVNISGICTRIVCLRNCTKKPVELVCGDDGRWYRNICELRQYKYCLGTGVSESSSANDWDCSRACKDLKAPVNGNVSFSKGIKQTSVASFACHPPYILEGSEERTCRETRKGSAWSGTQPVCTDPCDSHACDDYKECAVSAAGELECVCKSTTECPQEASFVCASNGHTYRSECHMNSRLCHDCVLNPSHCEGVQIYILKTGRCPTEDGLEKR